MATAAPFLIRTSRLLIRRWQPRDAPMLVEQITANLDHLRPWMPWALREPESIEAKARRIRTWHLKSQRGEEYFYGLFTPDESQVLGAIGSHRNIGAGAAALGYWIRKDRRGRGLITEAAAALTRAGFEIEGLHRIEIHCDPRNLLSAAVPRRLGFTHALTIANCVADPKLTPRDSMIWVMKRSEYSGSVAAATPYEVSCNGNHATTGR